MNVMTLNPKPSNTVLLQQPQISTKTEKSFVENHRDNQYSRKNMKLCTTFTEGAVNCGGYRKQPLQTELGELQVAYPHKPKKP